MQAGSMRQSTILNVSVVIRHDQQEGLCNKCPDPNKDWTARLQDMDCMLHEPCNTHPACMHTSPCSLSGAAVLPASGMKCKSKQ
eukprot:365608-Chlamydomonas_euryale.AAC.18